MSDALTDIARDNENAENVDRIFGLVKTYLLDPTPENRAPVTAFLDGVPMVRGYWGSSLRTFVDGIRKVLKMEDITEAKHAFIRLHKERYHDAIAKEIEALEE